MVVDRGFFANALHEASGCAGAPPKRRVFLICQERTDGRTLKLFSGLLEAGVPTPPKIRLEGGGPAPAGSVRYLPRDGLCGLCALNSELNIRHSSFVLQ